MMFQKARSTSTIDVFRAIKYIKPHQPHKIT
jgi:hypothetical protein